MIHKIIWEILGTQLKKANQFQGDGGEIKIKIKLIINMILQTRIKTGEGGKGKCNGKECTCLQF